MIFTLNAQWAESLSELQPLKTALNRPDSTARVLKLKRQQLLSDVKGGVLGIHKALVYAIEFQKRGLPHFTSCSSWMENNTPGKRLVDKVIRVELLDLLNHNVHNSVTRFMIHGPCGSAHSHCPSMIEVQGLSQTVLFSTSLFRRLWTKS